MLDFDLSLQQGEFQLRAAAKVPTVGVVGLCGESGSGKTTLLRCIAGLEQAQGHCQFKQTSWQTNVTFLPAQQRGIAYVFQDNRLFPHMTVEQNIGFAFKRRFTQSNATETTIGNVSDIISLLNIQVLAGKLPAQLSGGEQKRVAIARALASNPSLLILDEPLTGLHQSAKQECLELIERVTDTLKLSTLFVSHSFSEIARLADQLLIMRDGKIIANDELIHLSHSLDSPFSQSVDTAAVLEGELVSIDEDYSIAQVAIGEGTHIHIAFNNSTPIHKKLRLQIPAKDISISLSKAEQSSILNILPCTIVEVEFKSSASALLKLQLGEQFLLAMITRKSLDALQLKVGMPVFAQIKSIALLRGRTQ